MFMIFIDDVQKVRLLDVFFVAPVLVYAGAKESNLPNWLRVSLVGIGVATFFYNGSNYLKHTKKND